MAYINRQLTSAILECGQKVVIVEGARAVGKTSMAREEISSSGFSYYSLSDKSTYEIAKRDPEFWIRSITLPAIIDEAQRILELPLAIKEYMDTLEDGGVYLILTGSASIGRSGLDGQDPLARRSRRLTLGPLTQRELRGANANIIDELWYASPNPEYTGGLSEKELATQMTVGGFPSFACAQPPKTEREIRKQIQSDLDSVLGDTILPSERLDQIIARTILDRFLSLPGDILNVSNLSRELGIDGRTIERYFSILSNRFLIRYLPNLKSMPQKQRFTRSKVHPTDVSFSVETIKSEGGDPFGDRAVFGKLLESYVVSQIVPSVEWCSDVVDCFYWRESGKKPKEVDLVLLRDGQLVGIEVKAATSVSWDDFSGLFALSKDPKFHRGFLFYLGNEVKQFADKLWAMPIDSLWGQNAFLANGKEEGLTMYDSREHGDADNHDGNEMIDANLFLSYNHEDNKHLDGAMVDLANAIADEYEFQCGSKLQIFIDTKSLMWGDDWQREIDRNIEETQFLMPCITPRYLNSEACRGEFLAFLSETMKNKRCRLLSLIWQDPGPGTDSVRTAVKEHQYKDVSVLRDLTSTDPGYKKAVRSLVEEIKTVIAKTHAADGMQVDKAHANESDGGDDNDEGTEGFFKKVDRVNEEAERMKSKFVDIAERANSIGAAFEEIPMPNTGTGDYSKWAIRLASRVKDDVEAINSDFDVVEEAWSCVYNTTSDCLEIGSAMGSDISGLLQQLYSFKSELDGLKADDFASLVAVLPKLSTRLRPLAKVLQRYATTINDMRQMTEDLILTAEAAN